MERAIITPPCYASEFDNLRTWDATWDAVFINSYESLARGQNFYKTRVRIGRKCTSEDVVREFHTKGKKVTKAESVADIICVFDPEALYLRHGWSVSLIDHKRMSSLIIYALWLGISGIWERSTSNQGPGCTWVDSFQLPVLCAPVIWQHACKL